MPDNINELTKSLQDYTELKAYSSAQHKAILDLNKKINVLEKENVELKKSVSLTNAKKNQEEKTEKNDKDLTDEQAICEMQLSVLRDRSLEGELTLEEAKKVDMFARLLLQLKNPSKSTQDKTSKMDTKELLKLVEGGIPDGKIN